VHEWYGVFQYYSRLSGWLGFPGRCPAQDGSNGRASKAGAGQAISSEVLLKAGGISKMAQVMIEEIVDYLSNDFRRALEAAVLEVLPEAEVDRHELLRAFGRAVRRKFSTWKTVPDQYV
jgi:hypothetical protein